MYIKKTLCREDGIQHVPSKDYFNHNDCKEETEY